MAKAIIVYESKHGNTKRVAETIAEGMREVAGTEATVAEVSHLEFSEIPGFDGILIGSPNHMGKSTDAIKKFIDQIGKLKLQGKWGAVFDTYIGGDFEKAVKKMEKQLGEKVPGLKLMAGGLSIKVAGMKGPVSQGELPKCQEFGRKIATLVKTGP
ncbi:MAG: flavodoxin domain-containing protein [Chloroflexi bacterium]|nr:flavodoxin domain-containing protein [Chloroflexota bacterium]